MSQIINAMTVDVEDYFHVSAFENTSSKIFNTSCVQDPVETLPVPTFEKLSTSPYRSTRTSVA